MNLSALLKVKTRIGQLPELGRQLLQTAKSKAQEIKLAEAENKLNLSALTQPKISYTPPVKIPEFISPQFVEKFTPEEKERKPMNFSSLIEPLKKAGEKVGEFITPIKEVRQEAQVIYGKLSKEGKPEAEIKTEIQKMMDKKYIDWLYTPPIGSKIEFVNGEVKIEQGVIADVLGGVGSLENISKNIIKSIAKSKVPEVIKRGLEKIGIKNYTDDLINKLVKTTKEVEVESLLKKVGGVPEELTGERAVRVSEEFKVGDILDPQGKTNMVGKVKIREITGNTLKFIDSEGTEFAGMQRSTVRTLVKEGSWKKVGGEPGMPEARNISKGELSQFRSRIADDFFPDKTEISLSELNQVIQKTEQRLVKTTSRVSKSLRQGELAVLRDIREQLLSKSIPGVAPVVRATPKELEPLAEEARKSTTAEQLISKRYGKLQHSSETDLFEIQRMEESNIEVMKNSLEKAGRKPEDIERIKNQISVAERWVNDSKELRNLGFKTYGEFFEQTTKGAKPAITGIPKELEPLAVEARKFKSAEEFVKAKATLMRGAKTTEIRPGEVGVYLTSDRKMAEVFAGKEGVITEVFADIKKTYKIPKASEFEWLDALIENPRDYSKFVNELKAKGYDSILSSDKKQLLVFDRNKAFTKSQLTDFYNQAVKTKGLQPQRLVQPIERAKISQKELPKIRPTKPSELGKVVPPPAQVVRPSLEPIIPRLPAVIQGETFTLGETGKVYSATKKEIQNALKAEQKAIKLEAKQRKVREEAIKRVNRFRGNTDNIVESLKSRHLSDEDIANIVLEDGTKLTDVVKIKRNADRSLSAVITKKEIDDIAKSYADEIPKRKWEKRSALVEGIEVPIKLAKSIELPYVYFERKGLNQIYEPIVQAGRDAEVMKNQFIKRFKDAGLFKEGGWFTADRFNLSKNEAKGVAEYYLGRQGRTAEISLTELSEKGRKFVEIFDGIIQETEERFFETAKKMGKTPRKVENYAPIMTSKDIKLVDEGGAMDWLFRNHPAFFSLKERVKKVPIELYELDYREVAARWLEGITQFLNYGETTNKLKYLINSDQFKNIVKTEDHQFISKWLQEITTPELPVSVGGQALNAMSRLLRKGVAIGSLGLNYASVLKQALTQIPILIIEKAPPKLKSQYAKAFGINVADLPSITKRRGDIAIQDLQGKIGRIFTGALTEFDRKNAQLSLNALLDKEYNKFLREGIEITPEIQKVIEKRAQDTIDMWYGGFFKGQRPEAFRKELGNFILMFLYPLTSQLNGFYRAILTAKGVGKVEKTAEVLAAAVAIAYAEQVIENLSPQWSDEVGMIKDVSVSLTGNIPLASQIAWAIATEQDVQISPVIGNINNILRNIGKGEGEKAAWGFAETFGLPKQIRRIKEGLEIMEEGGITDNEGKMLAPVQDTMELVRSFLRGKYGSMAAQDWMRNIGEKSEDRRWFVPQVEFLQNGDYERKADLYWQFTPEEQKELREFLSENQQKKLDNALKKKISPASSALDRLRQATQLGIGKNQALNNLMEAVGK